MSDARPTTRRRGWGAFVAVATLVSALALSAGTTSVAAAAGNRRAFGPAIDAIDYVPQVRCDPHAKPGVLAFRAFAMRNFGAGDLGITRGCSGGGTSEHKEGRAWDAAYNYYNPVQRARAQRLIAWLLAPDAYGNPAANARRLGIMYMIWHNHIWAPYAMDEGWRPYHGPDPHTSHIHISFTWEGALKHSTWWEPGRSQLDPYQQWGGDSATLEATAGGEDVLAPILTVTPVDPPAPKRPKPLVTKVYDEANGAVISEEHFTR